MKVLIADDENQHAFLLELFLKKWGYEVCSVDNGLDALQMLEIESSDCVAILDCDMPGLDGLEVTRRIRRSGHRNIYVLMLTARTQADDRARAAEAGVDAFLAKPYEPEELRALIAAGRAALEKIGLSPA
jgi:phosphoserine phosphatase RsbU/P